MFADYPSYQPRRPLRRPNGAAGPRPSGGIRNTGRGSAGGSSNAGFWVAVGGDGVGGSTPAGTVAKESRRVEEPSEPRALRPSLTIFIPMRWTPTLLLLPLLSCAETTAP